MPISFAEKVSRLPARAPWILRDVVSNQEIELHKLDGGIEVEYGVLYECHVEGIGDMGPFKDGLFCGTRGQSRRVEAILVWIQPRTP